METGCIVRVEKNKDNPYTIVPKSMSEDASLSWGARGLLAYLFGKPDNWQVRMTDLERNATDGRERLRSLMCELQEHGYLKRVKKRTAEGKWYYVTTVYESPVKTEEADHEREAALGNTVDIPLNDSMSNEEDTRDAGASDVLPLAFPDWLAYIEKSNNKIAAVRRMVATLYPNKEPPTFGRIGVAAKRLGYPRLAQLLWEASTRPPVGDILGWVEALAKNKGKEPPPKVVERDGFFIMPSSTQEK